MICTMTQWMVSRSLDTGKPLSGMAARHIGRCEKCRDFADSSQSLDTGLRRDAGGFLLEGDDILDKKIISALPGTPVSRSVHRRRFMPVPALAAALVVVVVAAVLLLQIGPGTIPNPGEDHSFGPPGPINTTGILQDIAAGVESPIEREMRSLEQAVKSAAQSLLSDLDLKLPADGPQS